MVVKTNTIKSADAIQAFDDFLLATREEARLRGIESGKLKCTDITSDVLWLDGKIEVFLKKLFLQLNPSATFHDAKKMAYRTKQRLARVAKQTAHVEKSLNTIAKPRRAFIRRMKRKKKLFRVFAFIFGFIDFVLSYSIFEEVSEALWVSVALAAGMPILLYTLAGAVVALWRSKSHAGLKFGGIAVVFGSMLGLFFFLASLQGYAAYENSGENFGGIVPLFLLLSFIIFLGNVSIHFKKPNEQKDEELDEAIEDAEEFSSLEIQRESLATTRTKLEDSLDDVELQAAIDLGFLFEWIGLGNSGMKQLRAEFDAGYQSMAPGLSPTCTYDSKRHFESNLKTFLQKYITMVVFFLTSWITLSCQSLDCTILYDRSDERIVIPETGSISDRFLADDALLFKAAEIRVRVMSDRHYDYSFQAGMPPAHRWIAKKKERVRLLKKIREDLSSSLDDIIGLAHTTSESNVIPIIWHELVRQSQSDKDRTVLLVYSDLLHHGAVSLYDEDTRYRFQHDPRSILSDLGISDQMYSKEGMELHIYYYPSSTYDDQLFYQCVEGWKTLLQSTSVTIFIHTHNQNH